MLSIKKIFQLGILIHCIIFSNLYGTEQDKRLETTKLINVLLVTDDNYGSSFIVGDDKIKSISQQFEEFGWNMIISGVKDTILPCDWGSKTFGTERMIVTQKISEIKNLAEFTAWCRGVRLLAAADIIRGKNVIGHFDYFDEYKAAGANYIEYSFLNGRMEKNYSIM